MFKKNLLLVVVLVSFITPLMASESLAPLPKIRVKKVSQEKADELGKLLVVEGSDSKKLLKKGANANVVLTNLGDETPFMQALSAKEYASTDLYIAAGADVNYRTSRDSVPLIAYYLEQNMADVATYLYKRGATLPGPTESFKSMNFPGLVASAGALEILKALKARGEDILQVYRVQKGDTVATYNLLAFAVFGDQKEKLGTENIALINFLINEKIDINAPLTMTITGGDSLEATALTLAAMAGELTVIDMLIKAGANLNSSTTVKELGHTMVFDLSIIPILNNNTNLLKVLIKGGANANGTVVMKKGEEVIAHIPLMVYAISLGDTEVISLLKKSGVDLNQQLISSPALGVQTNATTVLEYIAENKNKDIKALFSSELEALEDSSDSTILQE